MLLDTDDKIKQVGRTTAIQIEHLEFAAKRIKVFAEMNYTSRVIEYVYDFKIGRYTHYLNEFFINPTFPTFKLNNQSFNAKEQDKVLLWLIDRVDYHHKQFSLSENEIIYFEIN